jgi:hypothetical protein
MILFYLIVHLVTEKTIVEKREDNYKDWKNGLLQGQLHTAAMAGHRHLHRRQLLQRHVRFHAGIQVTGVFNILLSSIKKSLKSAIVNFTNHIWHKVEMRPSRQFHQCYTRAFFVRKFV